jgi:nucleotide-binding universal stress UspA family protein
VTAILDTRSDQPAAAQQLALRWRNVRRDLEGRGADEATLDAVDRELEGGGIHAGGSSVVLVAGGGEVLLSRHLPDPPQGDLDRGFVGPVPHLLPLVLAEQVDGPPRRRARRPGGADLYGMTGPPSASAAPRSAGTSAVEVTVEGDTENIQRSSPGGWSQRRFQQRSENTWERNAGDAAEEVTALADELGAELILVGGDERATGSSSTRSPSASRASPSGWTPGPAEGSSIEHLSEEVRRQVRTVVARRLTDVLSKLDEEQGQHDRAALGDRSGRRRPADGDRRDPPRPRGR